VIAGIDHVLIGVDDLDDAGMAWTRLGFTVSPRGRHLGWGTANACVMFAKDYLELLGVVDPTQFTNGLVERLALGEGALGLAWATDDAAALAHRFGVEPRDLARQIELPEASVLARFRNVYPDPGLTPGLSSFFCQHLTPDGVRREAWLDHPNGAIGIEGVTIVVEDPLALIPAYERLFGTHAVNRTDDVVAVHVGGHRLLFADPDDAIVLHPELAPEDLPTPPAIFLVTLRSRDLDRTADHLTDWQVPFDQTGGASIFVGADQATGTALEFLRR
jgi:hypothetical protein